MRSRNDLSLDSEVARARLLAGPVRMTKKKNILNVCRKGDVSNIVCYVQVQTPRPDPQIDHLFSLNHYFIYFFFVCEAVAKIEDRPNVLEMAVTHSNNITTLQERKKGSDRCCHMQIYCVS